MVDPIGLTALSIQQDIQRMSVIANNTANALTPGFKREYLVQTGQLGVPQSSSLALSGNSLVGSVLSPVADTRPGVPRQTGSTFDIAILGDGFFQVQTDRGVAYTRLGAFRLDDNARLVTQSGNVVSGLSGEITLSTLNPTIDRTGKIFELGKQVAQLKIVDFDKTTKMSNIGNGLLIPENNQAGHDLSTPKVVQGQLESSNVDSAQEMVRMMENFRHFETSHRVIQAYDDMNDKLLRNLGQF